MPGVSRKIICEVSVVRMPVTRLRVVCGLGLTMATFSPRIWFSNVDLPTLGRPTIAMVPERNGSGCFSLFLFCVSGIKSMEYYDILDGSFKAARLYPPSQKATGVNPWMNARWVPSVALAKEGTLRPSPSEVGYGRRRSEGSARRSV